MSVPIAVVGWIPKIRISSGVISEPPPMPVMPTSTPMPNPKRTIAGSMVLFAALRAGYLSTFLTSLVRSAECARIPRMSRRRFARASGHSYGELRTIERLDLEVARRTRSSALVGPSGCGKSTLLELICGLREPAPATIAVGGADRRAPGASPAAPTCPRATSCCPGTRPSTTRRWRCATAASARPRRAAQAGELFERFGLAGFEAHAPGRALRRDAPAGRLPAHPGRRQAAARPRRALRLARRDHPGGDAGVAGRGAAAPTRAPSSSSPTTSRRRSTSPTASSSSPPARPGSSPSCGAPAPRAADRDAAVTDPAFVAVREQALRALHEGSR